MKPRKRKPNGKLKEWRRWRLQQEFSPPLFYETQAVSWFQCGHMGSAMRHAFAAATAYLHAADCCPQNSPEWLTEYNNRMRACQQCMAQAIGFASRPGRDDKWCKPD